MANQPLISFVTHGRNDGYMGDFLWRLSTCLNKIALGVEAAGRLDQVEILVGDWGSPLPPLREVLPLNEQARRIATFCTVPREIATRHNGDGVYSYPAAANVPIRRARGQFIFSMDSDAYMPQETAAFLLRLAAGEQLPGIDLATSFFWLSRLHIPYGFLTENRSIAELDSFIRDQPDKLVLTGKCNLKEFRGGAVAIFGRRELFHQIRGYNESLIYWGWADVDIHYRLAMAAQAHDLWDLCARMYHLEHYPTRGSVVGNRKHNPMEIPTTAIVNGLSWGLADEAVDISSSVAAVSAASQPCDVSAQGTSVLPSALASRPRNFVVSGTAFWNPGDDFVREGVLRVLREIFPGEPLNLQFYNFGQDQFPKSKFQGVGNELSAGDLASSRDIIDGVIVAGLSAGHEIKDLYEWINANHLEDRVFLIGAGYENSYCAEHIAQEPEATIFRQARAIVGRTEKHPDFIDHCRAPYVHLNCPAILSVPEVKTVSASRKIQRIGFSIQLPEGSGIPNQTAGRPSVELALEVLAALARTHEVEVIAHHKSEYFHFAKLLKDTGIPVLYSAFAADLHKTYPRYDLVVTTRLHASLFANGHGIPGIIINDTDRHTHALRGFPHSVAVNSRAAFDREFARVNALDLAQVAVELEQFKKGLLAQYVLTLRQPFQTVERPKPVSGAVAPATANEPEIAHALPVHFFTIVLNGQPFMPHHFEVLRQLPFKWHWHIVEGVAELNHDTGWSRAAGGRIPSSLHSNGLSVDGTTEYLDALQREFPDHITIHRAPVGRFWDGKREMVNAPLASIRDECLLWQIDADELWTVSQIIRARQLFLSHPDRSSAYFFCHYFVGPDRVINSRDTYGNNSSYEWLRVWRYLPGDRWAAHEPPRLLRSVPGQDPADVGALNPFTHAETESFGLVFQHYAYATKAQVQFKQDYYGYAGAVTRWEQLQAASGFPVRLADYFPWVKDAATVDSRRSAGVVPLIQLEEAAATAPSTEVAPPQRILFVRTDSIGDAVLASSMLEPIRRRFPAAVLAVLCQEHVAPLYAASPWVQSVICFKRTEVETEAGRRQILAELAEFNPDLVLNSVRSRDALSDALTVALPGVRRIAIEGDLCNHTAAERADYDGQYTQLIRVPLSVKTELDCHRAFLDGLGIPTLTLQPAVWTSPEDDQLAEAFFAQEKLNPFRTLALFPFGQHAIRDYDGYAEALRGYDDWAILIFGAPESEAVCSELGAKLPGRVFNLAGRTNVREAAALLRRCRVMLGAETSGAHMACALGVPNVILLGGGHFGRFMPYSPLTSAAVLPLECFGCNWQCRHSRPHCVRDVAPTVLTEALRQTLALPSPLPRLFVPAAVAEQTAAGLPQRVEVRGLLSTEVQVIEVSPSNAEPSLPAEASALLVQAEEALALQDTARGLQLLEQAQLLAPSHTGLSLALANLHVQEGRLREAQVVLGQAAHADPANVMLHLFLAQICRATEDADGLVRALSQTLRLDPAQPDALRLLADLHGAAGRWKQAAVIYGNLLKRGSADIEVILALGRCFLETDQCEAALACGEEALRQHPNHAGARTLLAQLQHRSGAKPVPPEAVLPPEHERVTCRVCGSQQGKAVRHRADIVQCADCQTVYLRTRLTKDAMRRLYQSYADGGSHMALPNSVAEAERNGLTRDYFLKEILEFTEPSGRFLDVGCGWGAFLLNARKKGFAPQGIELTRKCVQYANESLQIPVVDTQLIETDLAAASLRVVTMNHVLEHLPEPRAALAKVWESLEPGGMFCGIVPNFDSACSTRLQDDWYWLDPQYHYTHFTPATLRKLLESAGFVVERVYTATGDYGVENVRKACLESDPKLADATYFEAELKRYEQQGHGEEIRFFARKPVAVAAGNRPLVSVIVSTFNAEKFLRSCLENLARQTIFDRTEIIVIDSGSEENERAVVEDFQKRFSNIRYVRTERESLYAAWNRGLALARGQYWVNANADDAMRDDALQVLAAGLDRHPEAQMAYADCAWTSQPNDQFPSKHIQKEVSYPDYVPAHTLFYCLTGCLQFWRADALRALGGFDASLRYAGDYEITVRLAQNGGNALHVADVLSLFYQNPHGLTQASTAAQDEHARIEARARTSTPIERLFKCRPSSSMETARAWTYLGLLALEVRVPWEKGVMRQDAYAFDCMRRAFEIEPECAEATLNYIVAATNTGRGDLVRALDESEHPVIQQALEKWRANAGFEKPRIGPAVVGPRFDSIQAHPDVLAEEPEAIRPWIARREGRFTFLSSRLIPAPRFEVYTDAELQRIGAELLKVLGGFPKFYAHFGGIGDALVLLSTFLDRSPDASVLSYPNSIPATRAFFEAFPDAGRVYFLPQSDNPRFHVILRWIMRTIPNCLGAGATPKEGYDEWNTKLDIEKAYGVCKTPNWPKRFGSNENSHRICLAPKGSLAGMVGSKRNIVDPALWPDLIYLVRQRGFEPVIIGTPDERLEYPALDGCSDCRSYSFAEQMTHIARSAALIGADSWAKSFSALAGVPTIVFEPLKGADWAGCKDPSDFVFIEPWPCIRMVKSLAQCFEALDRRVKAPTALAPVVLAPVARTTVSWEGPFDDCGSLAHINRQLAVRLAKEPSLSLARNQGSGAQITVRHSWPPNWRKPASGKLVVIQPWEFGSLPVAWVEQARNVTEFWVPSNYVRQVYLESGIDAAKVQVVPNGVDLDLFQPAAKPLALPTRKSFKFLFVGGTIPRKGIDLLLQAYLKNFTAADDVALVIKDFGGKTVYAGKTLGDEIQRLRSRPNCPEIVYLDRELAAEDLPGLYTACDCLVHPYRGEGFGLPVLEAMACGRPVMVTAGGATDDFVPDEASIKIPAQRRSLGRSVDGLPTAGEAWLLEPDLVNLCERMAWVAKNRAELTARGKAARQRALSFSWDRMAQTVAERLAILAAPPVARIATLAGAEAALVARDLPLAWQLGSAALERHPFHPEALLFLARVAQDAGDLVRARLCADRATQLVSTWKAARKFLKSLPRQAELRAHLPPLPELRDPAKPRLSVCLITKNEEAFLSRCLDSVRPVADEIIVVDTGSTDRTVEIARAAGAQVHQIVWRDDFSAARNVALSHATGDWILSIDADEELRAEARELLLKHLRDTAAIAFRLPIVDVGQESQGCSYVPRLFRNAPGVAFTGFIHEQAFPSLEAHRQEWGLQFKLGQAALVHHGYADSVQASRGKIERNLALLRRAVAQSPGDPNLLMNFGLELVRSGDLQAGLGQYRAAYEVLARRPARAISPELRETFLTQYATYSLRAANYPAILELFSTPLAKAAPLTASMHHLAGLAALETKQVPMATAHFRETVAKRGRPALSPVLPQVLTAAPEHCLAACLHKLGQTQDAARAFEKAIARDPNGGAIHQDYACFLRDTGRPVDALKVLHQRIRKDPSELDSWVLGAQIALADPNLHEFAVDWTTDATRCLPGNPELALFHAEALVLAQRPAEGALALANESLSTAPACVARRIACRLLADEPLPTLGRASSEQTSEEFLKFYRLLVRRGAAAQIETINDRLEVLAGVLPNAARLLQSVLLEAAA